MSTFRPLNDDEPPPNPVPVVRKFRNPDVAKGMRICGHCQQEKPLNADHFNSDASKPGGYKTICKQCRAAKRNAKQLQEAAEILDKLDLATVMQLSQAKPGGTAIPHAAEIYQNVMALLGGVQGFAMHYVGNLIAAKPGSQTRERMLTGMMKLGQAVSDQNKVAMPTELMDDEQLAKAIDEREQRLKIVPAEVRDAKEAG